MKKTITINLNNIVFTIDDDAYELLDKYLNDLRNHFSADESQDIIDDIEARIAELFNERIERIKKVIILSDVQDIITIMGNPSDFISEDDDKEEKASTTSSDKKKRTHKYYRDGENILLGGVASGLAAYFNMDITMMRVLFLVAFVVFSVLGGGWFAIIVYVVVWIVAPKAITPSQRLEMQGEDVTVENIKTEFDNVRNYVESDKFKEKTKSVGEKTISIVSLFFKIIVGIIAGIFVLACFAIVTAIFSLLLVLIFSPDFVRDIIPFSSLEFGTTMSDGTGILILLSMLFVVICPIVMIIYGITRFFSGNKKNHSKVFLSIVTSVWVIALLTFIFFSVSGLKNGYWKGFSDDIEWDINWNGEKESETRPCPHFNAIDVSGNIRLSISQDTIQQLTVSSKPGKLSDIVTEVNNNVLRVYSIATRKETPIEIVLSTDSIVKIMGKGACIVYSKTPLRSHSFYMELLGASKADLDLQVTDKTTIHNVGASNMQLSGTTDYFDASVAGAGQLRASNLKTQQADVKAVGASYVEIYASQELNANAAGASNIKCFGQPQKINKKTAGLSSVNIVAN